ncbi:unnamed protein product [Brachionus calyciflorus]|uniref:Uncharacterized protein n=1 Tax=Brachionus calyciflorus TaxID=104777 RepID=A0A813PMY9_9BILA|nr:unnamed protein product [Brachionus calyciflorus]
MVGYQIDDLKIPITSNKLVISQIADAIICTVSHYICKNFDVYIPDYPPEFKINVREKVFKLIDHCNKLNEPLFDPTCEENISLYKAFDSAINATAQTQTSPTLTYSLETQTSPTIQSGLFSSSRAPKSVFFSTETQTSPVRLPDKIHKSSEANISRSIFSVETQTNPNQNRSEKFDKSTEANISRSINSVRTQTKFPRPNNASIETQTSPQQEPSHEQKQSTPHKPIQTHQKENTETSTPNISAAALSQSPENKSVEPKPTTIRKSRIPVRSSLKSVDSKNKPLRFVLIYLEEIEFITKEEHDHILKFGNFQDRLLTLEMILNLVIFSNNKFKLRKNKNQLDDIDKDIIEKRENLRQLYENFNYELIEKSCKSELNFHEIAKKLDKFKVDGFNVSSDAIVEYFHRQTHFLMETDKYPFLIPGYSKCLSFGKADPILKHLFTYDEEKAADMMFILKKLMDLCLLPKEMARDIFDFYNFELNRELFESILNNNIDRDMEKKFEEARKIQRSHKFELPNIDIVKSAITLYEFTSTNLGQFLSKNLPKETDEGETQEARSNDESMNSSQLEKSIIDDTSTEIKPKSRTNSGSNYNYGNLIQSIKSGDGEFYEYLYSKKNLSTSGTKDGSELTKKFELDLKDEFKDDLDIVMSNITSERSSKASENELISSISIELVDDVFDQE